MNKVAIFLETTLSVHDAVKILPSADYYDSVKKGDVIDAVAKGYDLILIIDGCFGWTAAVWHKEIMFALKKGVNVVGCSSMGALRAAELDVYGMNGYGEIYEMYKNSIIDGDDEVAIAYNMESGETTIPLINLRKTLTKLGYSEKSNLLEDFKNIFYKERTWGSIKKVVNKEIFKNIYSNYIDLKRSDAISLLTNISHYFLLDKKKELKKTSALNFFEKLMFEEKYGLKLLDFASSLDISLAINKEVVYRSKRLLRLTGEKISRKNIILFCKLVNLVDSSEFTLSDDYVINSIYRFREDKGFIDGEFFYEWLEKKYILSCDLVMLYHDFFLIKKIYELKYNFNDIF